MMLKDLITVNKKERLRRQRANTARNIAASAAIGLAAGAALGTLLAPQSGQQTRQDIKHFAEDAVDKVRDAAGTLRDNACDAVSDVK